MKLFRVYISAKTDAYTFSVRFSAEEKAKRPQLCYMPFGTGPRSCIGQRLALLEAKIALMGVLKKFSLVRAPETKVCMLPDLSTSWVSLQ